MLTSYFNLDHIDFYKNNKSCKFYEDDLDEDNSDNDIDNE